MTAVRDAYPRTSHRYYRMKARWLGMERLAHWDRNAPLPERPERVIPWAEAERLVLGAYGGFAPEMAEIAGRFFRSGWIDAPVRPGKAPGARHATLANFMTTELSAFYFDTRKDTLYCDPPSSLARKAALTTVDIICDAILRWLAPVLSFCLLYTSPSPRDRTRSRMPSSA